MLLAERLNIATCSLLIGGNIMAFSFIIGQWANSHGWILDHYNLTGHSSSSPGFVADNRVQRPHQSECKWSCLVGHGWEGIRQLFTLFLIALLTSYWLNKFFSRLTLKAFELSKSERGKKIFFRTERGKYGFWTDKWTPEALIDQKFIPNLQLTGPSSVTALL